MSREIELKLRLPPKQAQRLLTSPLLAGVVPEKTRLFNTYFDTPDQDLRARGIALRLRRKGRSLWLMTVKGGDSGAGGLAQRSEWEAPTRPGCFDFSIVGDPALRAFLEARQARLQALFTTDFTRTAWRLKTPDATLELALDRGHVKAMALSGERKMLSQPLCEVEIELIEGRSTDALFDLAIALASDVHLHPEIVSKAERGYALARGVASAPVRVPSPKIGRDTLPVDAFRALASSCLIQLQRNEAGVIAGVHPEYVHQARVAIRRLRSAFRVFGPVLSEDFVATYLPRWTRLAAALGGARDWDVFLAEMLAPLDEAFPGNADLASLRTRAEAHRLAAHKTAVQALTQEDYSRLLLAFSAALLREAEPTMARTGCARAPSKLRRFAAQRLQKRWAKIALLARGNTQMSAPRRHRLRIEFKKLRYALEFFAPILPIRGLADYLAVLARVQQASGLLNDQATARQLIASLRPSASCEALLSGWMAGRTQLLLSALETELQCFLSSGKPW